MFVAALTLLFPRITFGDTPEVLRHCVVSRCFHKAFIGL